jgi:hypothetical protein
MAYGKLRVDSIETSAKIIALDGLVEDDRQVIAGTGLIGGGDLSGNVTVNADVASQAEAEAGTASNKLMTPQRTNQAITARIENSVSSTTTTNAAAASAVKTAYDLAAAALPKSGGAMTGAVTFSNTQRFDSIVGISSPGAYNITSSDAGTVIIASSTVNVLSGVMTQYNAVSIFNNTSGNIAVTPDAGMTLYLAGQSGTGSRTLAQRGLATIYFLNSATAVIAGAGLS